MRLTKLRSGIVPLFALLALGVGMAGCSGDDGDNGTDGTDGAPALRARRVQPAAWAPRARRVPRVLAPRSSRSSHVTSATAMASLTARRRMHAAAVPARHRHVAYRQAGADLVVTFNVKVDGTDATDFTIRSYTAAPAYGCHDTHRDRHAGIITTCRFDVDRQRQLQHHDSTVVATDPRPSLRATCSAWRTPQRDPRTSSRSTIRCADRGRGQQPGLQQLPRPTGSRHPLRLSGGRAAVHGLPDSTDY